MRAMAVNINKIRAFLEQKQSIKVIAVNFRTDTGYLHNLALRSRADFAT